jgi:SAM-dependent methyltransferase
MALAELRPGEVVLDLGSGSIDVLLSAQRFGPSGAAYGLDMTDEMLQLAQRNRVAARVENARFLKGQMEEIPLPDASVDVVISNCMINLTADKDRVLGEAFRVLWPGGRFAVSDIVVGGQLPASTRRDLAAWSACIAGVLSEQEYRTKLAAAGFTSIDIETLQTHALADLKGSACCIGVGSLPRQREGDCQPAHLGVRPGPEAGRLGAMTGLHQLNPAQPRTISPLASSNPGYPARLLRHLE